MVPNPLSFNGKTLIISLAESSIGPSIITLKDSEIFSDKFDITTDSLLGKISSESFASTLFEAYTLFLRINDDLLLSSLVVSLSEEYNSVLKRIFLVETESVGDSVITPRI